MIKIKITNQSNLITKIDVFGHANATNVNKNKNKNDLVCAAITGIISGSLNALDQIYKTDVELKVLNNKVIIENKNLNIQSLQMMLQMLKIQLKTIWIQYKHYIELKEVN